MVQAIREIVTVEEGGVVRLRSGQLSVGDQVELIVLLDPPSSATPASSPNSQGWRAFAGALNSGNPRAADNDIIDADLARPADQQKAD